MFEETSARSSSDWHDPSTGSHEYDVLVQMQQLRGLNMAGEDTSGDIVDQESSSNPLLPT